MSLSNTSAGYAIRSTVVIRNLPRTALTSDVRRMLESYRIENVQNVFLEYHRFMPVGKAYVTFTRPVFAQPAYLRLRTAQMSGMPLNVTATSTLDNALRRTWEFNARGEAMARGALTGNGPEAGVGEHGKSVVIWGLPGRMTTEQLKAYLRTFRLASTEGDTEVISKIESPGRPALTSRHYVRTASTSEAHRIVRDLHMTLLKQNGRHYMLRAQVIY